MPTPEETEAELVRALEFLDRFEDHTLDVITIGSPSAEDAPFLGRNISKLSPFVSNLIERKVVADVAEELDPEGGFDWIRQDPGWPDAGLTHNGALVGGFEIKAWYVLATEITGRYHNAQSAIADLDARVILVPWVMDRIVYGSPLILDYLAVDALELAIARDTKYHVPPGRIVVEPEDQGDRAANLRQTNVIGQKLQTTTDEQRKTADMFVERFNVGPVPHAPDTRTLNDYLLSNYPYREESNFGKIGRCGHAGVKTFETNTLDTTYLGQSLRQWRVTLGDLEGSDHVDRERAEMIVEALYETLEGKD